MALERELKQLEREISNYEWVPRTSSGRQISPSLLRRQIIQFLAESSMSQTEFLRKAGINSGSYNKFKNPDYYKKEWSACSNQSYWRAARFLAREAIRKKIRARDAKKRVKAGAKKRKRDGASSSSSSSSAALAVAEASLSKKQKKVRAEALVEKILSVPGVD